MKILKNWLIPNHPKWFYSIFIAFVAQNAIFPQKSGSENKSFQNFFGALGGLQDIFLLEIKQHHYYG